MNLKDEIESNEESIKTVDSSNIVTRSSDNWCFVDSVTAIRFFRIDRAQVSSI